MSVKGNTGVRKEELQIVPYRGNKVLQWAQAVSKSLHKGYYSLRYGGDGGYAKFKAMGKQYHWQPLNANKRLNEVTMLASHNGLIAKEDGWLYSQQNWTLQKQLDAGVRVFEFDMELHGETLTICHTPPKNMPDIQKLGPYATFEEKLDELVVWMRENKGEIIFITLDIWRDPNIMAEHLNKVMEKHKELIYTDKDFKKNGEWPTIGQMRQSGKRLAFINYKDYECEYTLSRFDYLISTEVTTSVTDARGVLLNNCRGEVPTREHKLHMVQHHAILSNRLYSRIFSISHSALEWLGYLDPIHSGKLSLSDNKVSTIQQVLDSKPFGEEHTNIIMLDHVDEFLLDGGMKLLNQMNQ